MNPIVIIFGLLLFCCGTIGRVIGILLIVIALCLILNSWSILVIPIIAIIIAHLLGYIAFGLKEKYDYKKMLKRYERIVWRENSEAVHVACREWAAGVPLNTIVDKIGELYNDHAATQPNTPNPYATPTGSKPSKRSISKWLKETY